MHPLKILEIHHMMFRFVKNVQIIRLKKYLIGIKTFGINSGDQKVAQFKANITEWASLINQMQENAKESDGTFKTKRNQ